MSALGPYRGPVPVTTCDRCGERILRWPCFDERTRTFTGREMTDPSAPPESRWYLPRGRGAVHGGIEEVPGDQPYLVLHRCLDTRRGAAESTATAIEPLTEIPLRTDVPTVAELPLPDPTWAYSYRYPSSWAHVVTGADHRGVCGAGVLDPDGLDARERERMARMRVCPACRRRLGGRRAG